MSRADRLSAECHAQVCAALKDRVRAGVPVLPLVRGEIAPELLLGLDASGRALQPEVALTDHEHDHELDHNHDEHSHAHDHHHVAMCSLLIQREGSWEREPLEAQLRSLLAAHPVLRLKGRLRQSDRRLPLQIQAVGSRLECWYEASPASSAEGPALELIILGADADEGRLRAAFEELQAPATAVAQGT